MFYIPPSGAALVRALLNIYTGRGKGETSRAGPIRAFLDPRWILNSLSWIYGLHTSTSWHWRTAVGLPIIQPVWGSVNENLLWSFISVIITRDYCSDAHCMKLCWCYILIFKFVDFIIYVLVDCVCLFPHLNVYSLEIILCCNSEVLNLITYHKIK